MTSIGRMPEKERRKARRYNHIARDLRSGKYNQKIIPNKKKNWTDFEDQEDD